MHFVVFSLCCYCCFANLYIRFARNSLPYAQSTIIICAWFEQIKNFLHFSTQTFGIGIRDCLDYLETHNLIFIIYVFDWFQLLDLIVRGGFSTTITWCWLESREKNYNMHRFGIDFDLWCCRCCHRHSCCCCCCFCASLTSLRIQIIMIIMIIIIGDRFLLIQLAVQQQQQMSHVDLICGNSKHFRNGVSFGKLQDNDEFNQLIRNG